MKKGLLVIVLALSLSNLFAQDVRLPPPAGKSGTDVLSAIRNRKISKVFVKKEIPAADLSTILWSGLGLRGVDAVSSATKAGRNISFSGDNAYINMYLLSDKGSWKYLADTNALQFIRSGDARSLVSPAAIPTAAAMILFTVDNALTPSFLKANPALFLQMSHATAGFAAQNIGLTASVLKLGSIVQYTLKVQGAKENLKLAKEEVPLFIQQLGYTE